MEQGPDIAQAEVFRSLLAERRAELCDRLDEQAITLARDERCDDSPGARRKRLRIKEIGAEIREIDRMMNALIVRLLWADPKQAIDNGAVRAGHVHTGTGRELP
jgi:hypothetical protein